MLGAVCHDLGKPATTAFIDGRIRSIDHEQAGVEPTLALLDRLNVHSIDGFDVRNQVVGLVANHLKPGMFRKAPNVGDGAFRRLAQKVDLELLARLARADCLGRTGEFDCSAMDWFLERARALGVEHQPPAPLLLGRHVLELGMTPWPARGRDPQAGVRETAGRRDQDGRGSDRGGEGLIANARSNSRRPWSTSAVDALFALAKSGIRRDVARIRHRIHIPSRHDRHARLRTGSIRAQARRQPPPRRSARPPDWLRRTASARPPRI